MEEVSGSTPLRSTQKETAPEGRFLFVWTVSKGGTTFAARLENRIQP
jgi:hypothetical protein